MNKESLYKIAIGLISIFFLILSILIGFFFNETYLIIFIVFIFLFFMFFLAELYLRVQHNIDKLKNLEEKNIGFEIRNLKDLSEQIIDFLEVLVQHLEALKKERISNQDFFNQKFNEITDMQKKLASGVEDLFNSQYEQTVKLQKDLERKFDDLMKKSKSKSK